MDWGTRPKVPAITYSSFTGLGKGTHIFSQKDGWRIEEAHAFLIIHSANIFECLLCAKHCLGAVSLAAVQHLAHGEDK